LEYLLTCIREVDRKLASGFSRFSSADIGSFLSLSFSFSRFPYNISCHCVIRPPLTLYPISVDGWNDGDKRRKRKKKRKKGTSEPDGFLARLIEPNDQNDLIDDTKIIAAFPSRVAHCCQKAEFIGWIESASRSG